MRRLEGLVFWLDSPRLHAAAAGDREISLRCLRVSQVSRRIDELFRILPYHRERSRPFGEAIDEYKGSGRC